MSKKIALTYSTNYNLCNSNIKISLLSEKHDHKSNGRTVGTPYSYISRSYKAEWFPHIIKPDEYDIRLLKSEHSKCR